MSEYLERIRNLTPEKLSVLMADVILNTEDTLRELRKTVHNQSDVRTLLINTIYCKVLKTHLKDGNSFDKAFTEVINHLYANTGDAVACYIEQCYDKRGRNVACFNFSDQDKEVDDFYVIDLDKYYEKFLKEDCTWNSVKNSSDLICTGFKTNSKYLLKNEAILIELDKICTKTMKNSEAYKSLKHFFETGRREY